MAESFTAQVNAWTKATEARMSVVFKQSAQDVFALAQKPVAAGGNMPIDTGFLRGSLQTGLNGSEGVSGPDAYVLAIAEANLGDTILGGWTADRRARPAQN